MKLAAALILGVAGCARFGTELTSAPDAGAEIVRGDAGTDAAPRAVDGGMTQGSQCTLSPGLAFAVRNGVLTNVGSVANGSVATVEVYQGFPVFTSAGGPTGPWAPPADESIDFGETPISSLGVRAVDFTEHDVAMAMGGAALTVTGWIQLADTASGPGGNRLVSNLQHAQDGHLPGFELVQVDTMLSLGVNDYNDFNGGPLSGPALSAKPDGGLPSDGWHFFAVVYDAETNGGHVKFFFGSPSTRATLESEADYGQGTIQVDSDAILTVGNCSDDDARTASNQSSRVPRAKIFGLRVFSRLLTTDEIACEQTLTR